MVTPFTLRPALSVRRAPRAVAPSLGRGKRRSPHQPYRQGDLDGLCGIYAVINALRALCPELTGKLSARLFKRLVKCLRGRLREPLDVIAGGMGHKTLGHLLGIAIEFVNFRLGISVKATPLSKPVRTAKAIGPLWRELSNVLSPARIAIFSVQGRMSHWTVATRIGPKHLFLLDSGSLKRFRRTHCTVGNGEGLYSIRPGEVVIVARRG